MTHLTTLTTRFALVFGLVFSGTAITVAQDFEEYRVGGQLFIAGNKYTANEDATDNAFLAGRDVLATGRYGDTVFLAAGDAEFGGVTEDDLFIVGGTVEVRGTVGKNLYAAGQTVHLSENATVAGTAFFAGATVEIDGVITGDVRAGGKTVILNAEIGGDVEIEGDNVTIGPRARIDGTLITRAEGFVDIDPAAVVTGGVTELEARDWTTTTPIEKGGLSLGAVIGLTVLAAVLHMVAPGFLANATESVSGRPLASAGMGLLTAIGGVLVAVIFAVTLIGIPVTVLLLASLAILAMLASVVAAYWAGSVARGFTANAGTDPLLASRIGLDPGGLRNSGCGWLGAGDRRDRGIPGVSGGLWRHRHGGARRPSRIPLTPTDSGDLKPLRQSPRHAPVKPRWTRASAFLVERGTHQPLLAAKSSYAALWTKQKKEKGQPEPE